jgi:hypothetical protein
LARTPRRALLIGLGSPFSHATIVVPGEPQPAEVRAPTLLAIAMFVVILAADAWLVFGQPPA